MQLERRLAEAGQQRQGLGRLTFAFADSVPTAGRGVLMLQGLVQYAVAGARALNGQRVFGMPTDKASINGMWIRVTCACAFAYFAVLCPPAMRVRAHSRVVCAATRAFAPETVAFAFTLLLLCSG